MVTAPIPELVKACSIFGRRVHGTLIRRHHSPNLAATRETFFLDFPEIMVLTISPASHHDNGHFMYPLRFYGGCVRNFRGLAE